MTPPVVGKGATPPAVEPPPAVRRGSPRTAMIVGCGRLGARLASSLGAAGSGVIAVDRSEAALRRLGADFGGFAVHGDATQPSVLRRAGIERCDAVLAVTENDNVNLMVAQVARVVFRTPRVLVRVFDPAREEIFEEFGIEAISPTLLAEREFLREVLQGPVARPVEP